jgi:hypothetical protein
VGGGVQAGSTRHVGHWMAYCTCPGWLWWWTIWWNEDGRGNRITQRILCSSATLSTTNPTWPDPGSNPGRRGGKPATNSLSYGAALSYLTHSLWRTFSINLSPSHFAGTRSSACLLQPQPMFPSYSGKQQDIDLYILICRHVDKNILN